MPSPEPCLTDAVVRAHVRKTCFGPVRSTQTQRGDRPDRVGIETEWIAADPNDPTRPVDLATVQKIAEDAGPLADAKVTLEPGGQIELSTAPLDLGTAIAAAAAGHITLAGAAAAHGLCLFGIGRDPLRTPSRLLHLPRYEAMERYFAGCAGSALDRAAGATMMTATAAIQVNLDTGSGDDVEWRWLLAHAVGPCIAAACANSPFAHGKPTGFRSSRLALWLRIDRSRAAPAAIEGLTPADAWARYVLDAHVMLILDGEDRACAQPSGLRFADWLEAGHRLGYPTIDDLDYHMTTLFPPVRPRGWLELRMCDALPEPWWRVPVAVTAALLYDADAGRRAYSAAHSTSGWWWEAARDGLNCRELHRAAVMCFDAALDALQRAHADAVTQDTVAAFAARYVRRGRAPADDALDEWARSGRVLPASDPAPVQ
jgi:glutamate--cysteine ligase